MTKREFVAPETAAEIAYKHTRVLMHALHTAHPVMYQGTARFIHTITAQRYAGGIQTVVYLANDPAPIDPELIQLQNNPT